MDMTRHKLESVTIKSASMMKEKSKEGRLTVGIDVVVTGVV
jgi:hypothetical protein